MVTEQSSAASGPGPDYSYTVGYALPPSKVESVIQPSLVSLAAERGMRLVAVDASRPLAEQGPLDLLIHKRYDNPWRAQLEAFSALHPSVPVVDPPAAILRLVDRLAMLDVVSELHPVAVNSAAGAPAAEYCLSVPNQVAVHDAAALASYGADQDDHPLGALRFPLIAKPLAVDGSAGSHAMSLVYRREGLRGVQAPVVLQEFVNHGGVLFKVYVVGGRATCVRRRSLPDVPADRLLDLGQDASVPFANISNLPPAVDRTTAAPGGADGKGGSICGDNDVEMPPACFVDEVSRGLRRALGLNLFNFDLIRATELDGDGRRRYFIIDINYFPGYAKMPGYETALTDFFSEMLRARPPVDDAHLGRASSIDSIAAHVPGIDLVAEAEPAAQTRA